MSHLTHNYIVLANGCWMWLGTLNSGGYGPHRRYYKAKYGEITKGKDLDHLCRAHFCVNPDHLEQVDRSTNILRGIGHGTETHCPKGHPYDELNTIIRRKRRECRICRRASASKRHDATYWREYRIRKKNLAHIQGASI